MVEQAPATQGAAPVDYNALPPPTPPDAFRHKKKRKHREDLMKKAEITINSLLDVLSVILVFLLKSYATSTIQVKPSPELQIPFTYSLEFAEDSTAITITLNNILMDDKPVVTLTGGKVSPGDMNGDFLIDPLLNKLQEEVTHLKRIGRVNKEAQFNATCTIISDRFVPADLLLKVMYTAGQAEYSKYKFLGVKTERP